MGGMDGIDLQYCTLLCWDGREMEFVYIPPRPFLLGLFAVIFSQLFVLGTKANTDTYHTNHFHSIPDYHDTIPDHTRL